MPLVYNPPDFNLLCDMWAPGLPPASDPPVAVDIPVQKYIYNKVSTLNLSLNEGLVQLRFPINSLVLSVIGQIFEVPKGSARYFKNLRIFQQHEGFPNEYILLLCVPCDSSGFLIAGKTNP